MPEMEMLNVTENKQVAELLLTLPSLGMVSPLPPTSIEIERAHRCSDMVQQAQSRQVSYLEG